MLSVILVTLMLAMLVLGVSMPFVLRALSVVFMVLWMIALVYFVFRCW